MIDSTQLLPPLSGLSADPVLFGVSEGLARLLPLPEDGAFALWPAGEGAICAYAQCARRGEPARLTGRGRPALLRPRS